MSLFYLRYRKKRDRKNISEDRGLVEALDHCMIFYTRVNMPLKETSRNPFAAQLPGFCDLQGLAPKLRTSL